MTRALDVLKNVRIASPCSQPWHTMEGDDRVRFCKHCSLNVYNLSDMSAKEAAVLIEETEGRLCIGYYMRADGSIITRDCPVGLRRIRKRMAWIAATAAAVLCFTFNVMASMGGRPRVAYSSIRWLKPFCQIANMLDPPSIRGMVAGRISTPQRIPQQGPRIVGKLKKAP